MPSGEGLHSSENKLTGTWCWIILLSTNSVQSGLLKPALLTDYTLEDGLCPFLPCPLSHFGLGLGTPTSGISELSDGFASYL